MTDATDQRTVYAVSQGCYSDYSVLFVTASKEIAEQFIADSGQTEDRYGDGYRVEEFGYHTERVEWWPSLWLTTEFKRTQDGEWSESNWENVSRDYGRRDRASGAEKYDHDAARGRCLSTRGWDHDRVRKAHADRVAQVRAENAGVA